MFLLLVTLTVIDSTEWWKQGPNQSIFEKVRLKVKKVTKEHIDNVVRNFYERRTKEMEQSLKVKQHHEKFMCLFLFI